jgi:CRP-like cAMP-binding protein
MTAHLTPLVRKLDRLYPLTEEEKQVLGSLSVHRVELPADTDIVREGDQPAESSLLLAGFACRYVLMPDGGRQIQSFHTPGDIVDIHSFLLDEMDHSIKTLTPTTLARIPHAALLALTESYPRITRALWKDTLSDGAIFRQWIANLGRRNAYERMAHLICELFAKLEAVGLSEGGTIDWPFTQAELGDATGLSVVHVTRTLRDLREAQLITIHRERLTVEDWPGLKRAGDFNAKYLQLTARSVDLRSLQ